MTYLRAGTQLRAPNYIIGGVCINGTTFDGSPKTRQLNINILALCHQSQTKNCASLDTNLLVKHLDRDPTDLNSIRGYYRLGLQNPTFQERTILRCELPWQEDSRRQELLRSEYGLCHSSAPLHAACSQSFQEQSRDCYCRDKECNDQETLAACAMLSDLKLAR